MRLRIPPLLVMLVFGVLMYGLDLFLPVGTFDFFGRWLLIWVVGIAGLSILVLGLAQFRRAATTTDPLLRTKTRVLVSEGVYAYSRNPMYLAMLLFLLAWGLYLGNAFNTLLAALFVAFMNRFQIRQEEAVLQEQFGKRFQQYCLAVRRWF